MLAFCETVLWRSAFETRCWITSEATWDSHTSYGDGQCWLSLRLLCRGSSRLNTAERGWLQTLLGSAKRSPRDVGLLPRRHKTATVMLLLGFLGGCCIAVQNATLKNPVKARNGLGRNGNVFGCRGVPQARQAPGGCSSRVPRSRQQKFLGLGSIPLHLRHGGGSRPALPGLHDVFCRLRSSGVPAFFFPRVGSAWALELGLAPWSCGPWVPWTPWGSGPLILWSPGPLVPWSPGPLVSWSAGLWLRLLECYEYCEKLARSSMWSF